MVSKRQWDEIFEPLLDAARRIGDGTSGLSRRTGQKLRNDRRDIENADRDLADGQEAPDRARDHDAPDPGSPDVDAPVQPLDVDTYAELRRRALTGDQLEHDHIPSAAALIRAREIELDRELDADELRELYNNAATIELPASVHRATRTYGGRNSQGQVSADAADLAAAANRDYVDRIALLLADGYSHDEISTSIRELYEMNLDRGIG